MTTSSSPQLLLDAFSDLSDPRSERGRQHALDAILLIAICAVIGGANDFVAVADYGRDHERWLSRWLSLPHGIPSHDTFSRVFQRLDPEALEEGLRCWLVRAHEPLRGVVAIDGKTLRRSHDHTHGQPPLHLVSAWTHDQGIILGQVATDAKSNEITTIPLLLEMLDLEDCTVTIDAIGCQRAMAAAILARKAHYILNLKSNQGNLLRNVAETLDYDRTYGVADHPPYSYHQTVHGGHGRIETRRCWAVAGDAYTACVDPDGVWPGLQSLVLVERERRQGDTVQVSHHYYITDRPAEARRLLQDIRHHWGIENTLHWVLDMVFREDDSRVRRDHGPRNLAALRRLATGLLKQEQTYPASYERKRRRADRDPHYLMRVLGI